MKFVRPSPVFNNSTAPSRTREKHDKQIRPLHRAQDHTFHNYVTKVIYLVRICSAASFRKAERRVIEFETRNLCPLISLSGMSSGSVRRLRSTQEPHTWCVRVSLVCGREEETGWGCSEDTLWEVGWAACCECFGSSALPEVRRSGSGRGRERWVLPVVESSGGL